MFTLQQSVNRSRQFSILSAFIISFICIIVSVWAIWSLELKWALFAVLGIIFPFVLVFFKDVRRITLGMLVFSIPLNADYNILYHPSPGGADAFTVGITEILILVLLFYTLINYVQQRTFRFRFFPAITIPAAALFVFYIVSMFASADLLWSSFDLFNLVKTILFFLVVANNIHNQEDVKLVISALFLGLLGQAVIVGLQFFLGPTRLNMLGLGESSQVLAFEMNTADVIRPGGTVGHCNHLARYIGLLLPVSIILSFSARNRMTRWFASLVTVAGMIALIYTLTRSSWIGLFISLMVIVPLMFIWRHVNFRTLLKFMGAAFVFAAIVVVFSNVIFGRITTYDLGSARTRITTAKVAWNIIKDHPIIGVGINNYGAMLEEYWDADDTFTRRAAVHNTYLLYLAEIGFAGFVMYMWLLIAFFKSVSRAVRSRQTYYSAVAIGIMGSFFGYLVTAFTDKSYKENYTLLLVFFALAAVVEAINYLDDTDNKAFMDHLSNRPQNYEIR